MTARKVAPLSHWLRLSVLVIVFALALAGLAAPSLGKLGEINFVNAEVPVVMKALADMSGTNIVVAPTVKGQITVRLKDVTLEEALQIITNLAGLSYANTNNAYVISPKGSQPAVATPVIKGEETNLIYTLKAVTAEQAAAAIGVAFRDVSLKPVGADRLVLNGEKHRLQAAKAFLEELDVPTAATPAATAVKVTETGEVLYNLKSAVPWQAKKYLEELYGRDGLIVSFAPTMQVAPAATPAAPETAGGAPGVVWASDKLVLRGPKPVIEKAISSLQVVDVDVPLVEKRCTVKRIYASQAIAYLLERYEQRGLVIFTAPMTYVEIAAKDSTAKDASAAATKSGQIGARVRRDLEGKLNVAEPIGDFIVRGPGDVVREALASLETIDVGPQRLEKIYTLRFLDAVAAEKQIEEIYGKEGLVVTVAPNRRGTTPEIIENTVKASVGGAKSGDKGGSQYLEVFDLVMRGPEGVVGRAVQLLDTLDVPPPQVRINTEIVSVSMDEKKNLGVDWAIQPTTRVSEAAVPDNPLKFGRFTRTEVSGIIATLNLLESNNKAKIISRPSTVVQNGREAFIHVGEKVFYQTVVSISESGAPLYSTESIDTGVTMKVRPIMSRDGIITLEFTTNVTGKPQLITGVANSTIPQFSENSSTTVLQVREGETLIIGGLIQSVDRTSETRVPGISRVPLIGKLFRNKEVTPQRSELLIMVTPTAVVPITATMPAPAATPAAQP